MILLRHTRPRGSEGLCYGRSELELDAGFEAHAARILAALPSVGRVVSSPRTRCLRLAERIARERDLELRVDGRVAEMDFGRWEGQHWDEIPRGELDAWAADFQNARPHGGESVAMLAARVGAALDDARPEVPPALWVTHSGVARAVCAALDHREGWDTALGFGAWLDMRAAAPQPSSQNFSIER